MSVLLCDHSTSAPYTLTNLYGQTFTYKPGSAEQASDWSDEDDE